MTPEISSGSINSHQILFSKLPQSSKLLPAAPSHPISIDSPFDRLFKILYEKGIVDNTGWFQIDMGKPLPALGFSQLNRLKAILFNQIKIKSSQNGFEDIEVSLMELLQFLASNPQMPKIQKIEVVGGAVLWTLGPEYFKQILEELGLSEEEIASILNQSDFNELFTVPPDIDIRIYLENNNTYYDLKDISSLITFFLAHRLSGNPDQQAMQLIDSQAYMKKKVVNNGINHFLTIGFGNRTNLNVDLLFINQKLQREELFVHDSFFINITLLLISPNLGGLSPHGNFTMGWTSSLLRGMKILHAQDASLIDLPGALMLFANYIKGWKSPKQELEQQLVKTVEAYWNLPDGPQFVLETLGKVILNHFPNKRVASIAFCCSLCDVLVRKGHKNISHQIIDRLLEEPSCVEKGSISAWEEIPSLLKEKQVPFEMLMASYTLMAYLHYFQKKTDPIHIQQNLHVTSNCGSPIFHWKHPSMGLYLPLSAELDKAFHLLKQLKEESEANHIEILKDAIFPEIDLDSSSIIENEFQDVYGIIHRASSNALAMLEEDNPSFRSYGFALLCYCGIIKDGPIYIAYLIKILPQILENESSHTVRQKLWRYFLLYLRHTNYEKFHSLNGNHVRQMQDCLANASIDPIEIKNLFCRTFSGISNLKAYFAVYHNWLSILEKSSNQSALDLGKFLINQYQKINLEWSLRILESLLTNKNFSYDDLFPLFTGICERYKIPSNQGFLNLQIFQLAKAAELLIGKINKHKTSRKLTYDPNSFLWLANQLSENHPNISQQLLSLSVSKNILAKHKDELSDAWLRNCRTVMATGNIDLIYKTWQRALRCIQESYLKQSDDWISFHINFLQVLMDFSTDSFGYINEIFQLLNTSSLKEEQLKELQDLIENYLKNTLLKLPPEEFLKITESPVGNYLPSSNQIFLLNDFIRQHTPKSIVDTMLASEKWINRIKDSGLISEDQNLLKGVLVELFTKVQIAEYVDTASALLRKLTSPNHPWGKMFTKHDESKVEMALPWHEFCLSNQLKEHVIENNIEILLNCISEKTSKSNLLRIALHIAEQKSLAKSQISILKSKLGVIISTLESYHRDNGTYPSTLGLLFKLLHEANIDVHAIPQTSQNFWRCLLEILQEKPLRSETLELVSSLAEMPKAKESKELEKEDTQLYFLLAEKYNSQNLPELSYKWLVKGFISLTDQDLASDHPFAKTSYHCCELLIQHKVYDKASLLLDKLYKRLNQEHREFIAKKFYQLSVELAKTNLKMALEILIQKNELMLLLPNTTDLRELALRIIDEILTQPKAIDKLQGILELARLYKIQDANTWLSILKLVLEAKELNKTDLAFAVFWDHYDKKIVKGTKLEIAACWSYLLTSMSILHSPCFEQLLDHYKEILLLYVDPEMEPLSFGIIENFLLGFFGLLNIPQKDEEELFQYHQRIFPVLEEIEFDFQGNCTDNQELNMHIAFVHAFLNTKVPEIFLNICTRFFLIIKRTNAIAAEKPLLSIANRIAHQYQFIKDDNCDCGEVILGIFNCLHNANVEATLYVAFLETFSKHPSQKLFEVSYNLALSFIQQQDKNKKISNEILKDMQTSVKRILVRLLEKNDTQNRICYLNLLLLSNTKNMFVGSELSELWGEFILSHFPKDNSIDKEELYLFLDMFLEYQHKTFDSIVMRNRCYNKFAEGLYLLSIRFTDYNAFSEYILAIGTVLDQLNTCNIILDSQRRTRVNLKTGIQNTEVSENTPITTELAQNFLSKEEAQILSYFKDNESKIPSKLFQKSQDRYANELFFHLIEELTHKILDERTDDLDAQLFIHSFAWAVIPTLIILYPNKAEEISKLFHHFVFKYLPCNKDLFTKHMQVVSYLFYSLQKKNILDSYPEITFECILYIDINLCLKPHISPTKQRKCFIHVLELLCKHQSPFFTWRSLLILDKLQHVIFNSHPEQLLKCYENIFPAVKCHPYFVVGNSTILDDLFKIIVMHQGLHELPMNKERSSVLSTLICQYFDLIFEIAKDIQTPPANSKIKDYYSYLMWSLECSKLLFCLKNHPDILLRMIDRMMPMGCIYFGVSGEDDIFELLTFCRHHFEEDIEAMQLIAKTLNRWITLLLKIYEESGKEHITDILENAVPNNFYLYSAEDLKEIMGVVMTKSKS